MKVSDFMLLVMKAKHPKTGKIYYFVDKCLPFGSSISCAIFQAFSNAISHIVTVIVKKGEHQLFGRLSVCCSNQEVVQPSGEYVHRSM